MLHKDNLKPAFVKNNIPVFFACNESYLPMFGVALQSLVATATEENNYDIWLLSSSLPEIVKQDLLSILKNHKNISLRFLDFSLFIPQKTKDRLFLNRYISIEAYFRIFIPNVFVEYDKFLWLDSDIVIKKDVANLFHTDIQDNWVAMAKNVYTIYACQNKDIKPAGLSMSFREYVLDYLKMDNINNYCNDGIMILNAKLLRENNFEETCLKTLHRLKNPNYHDQDLINIATEHHVYFLPLSWNHVWYMQDYEFLRGVIEDSLFEQYDQARHYPNIIHYAGDIKPWKNPDKWLADDFWQEARKTPFYQQIIMENTLKKLTYCAKSKGPFNVDYFLIYTILKYRKLKLQERFYKFLSKLSWLKNREKYLKYSQTIKQKRQQAKKLLKAN